MMAETAVPLVCGIGQPNHTCGEAAVGALAVQIRVGGLDGELQPAALLVCVKHLADFGEPAEAVFEPAQPQARGQSDPDSGERRFPPGYGTKGA